MSSSLRLALIAIVPVACSAMGCGGCFNSTSHATPIKLAIRVHPTTSLTPGEADDILDKSNHLLQAADWASDCACPVELKRAGLDTFETGNGTVSSEFDFDELFADAFASPSAATGSDPDLAPRTRQVRVVSDIYWCGAVIASAAGCSDEPGLRIAVTRRSSLVEGELWAHETGHTRGLPHRNTHWTAVMHASILPDHKELTVAECSMYRR